jgi:hypothetical protein
MARVLAKAILAGDIKTATPMAAELARGIEACHAGDRGALPKVLAWAIQTTAGSPEPPKS